MKKKEKRRRKKKLKKKKKNEQKEKGTIYFPRENLYSMDMEAPTK